MNVDKSEIHGQILDVHNTIQERQDSERQHSLTLLPHQHSSGDKLTFKQALPTHRPKLEVPPLS